MKNFTFIPNHIEINDGLPFEIIKGYEFRKANNEEIRLIDEQLEGLHGLLLSSYRLPYKKSFKFKDIPEGVHVSDKILNREQWKYYIVNYEGEGHLLYEFQLIANLYEMVLEFDIFNHEKYENGFSSGYSPELAFRFFNDKTIKHNQFVELETPQILSIEQLNHMKNSYEQLLKIKADYKDIMNSIYIFNSLRYLQNYNEFKTLGLFTVIESLITHEPLPNETGDSITRQIVYKIPLLFNRINDRIVFSDYFGDGKEDTIWKKLYSYRSSIAHGGDSNFKKELEILRSPVVVYNFMVESIKKLLLHSLKEPQLIQDLKKC